MTTAFKSVQAALVAALEAAPALSGVVVHKNRTRALAREEQSAILVRLDTSRDDDPDARKDTPPPKCHDHWCK